MKNMNAMNTYKIAVINLGSTSTKIAYYENDEQVYQKNIKHSVQELSQFSDIREQMDYRYEKIADCFKENGTNLEEIDCIVSRGGNISPHSGGIYKITEKFFEEGISGDFGVHPAALGPGIALRVADKGPIAISVDPPTTDEFDKLARYSGIREIQRISSFQALNQRAAAKKYAAQNDKNYEKLNLIVVHMGGGISVVAHHNGRMIDGNNALDGDGPFSTNRAGGLPTGSLIDMCFSGKYTHKEMLRKINGEGGLISYVGESDVQIIEKRASEDEKCREVLEAMCYQVSKEIGGAATVLKGNVDAIVFTGGMANSNLLMEMIKERISFIAPICLLPGEFEMETLAQSALEVLKGNVEPKEL